MRRLLGVSLAATLAATISGTVTPAHAEEVPGAANYEISGHGFGHGRGLSQYGARAAARDDATWRRIVDFYYPGTRVGRRGGTLDVLITAATRATLTVEAQQGLTLAVPGKPGVRQRLDRVRPEAGGWRISSKGKRSVVEYQVRGSWRRLTAVKGEAEFRGGAEPVTLRLPKGEDASYRGALRLVDGRTINVVDLDSYVRGVVAREMPSHWPKQALRAQAVVARSYAAHERANSGDADYDLCDNESCQVYGGADDEVASTDRAVRATRHRTVEFEGRPARTEYSASNGGLSSTGEFPYLVAQVDPWEVEDTNPNTRWGPIPFSEAELEEEWPEVGTITTMSFTREGTGDYGGWITAVTLTGTAGTTTITGEDFAFTLNLRSPWLKVVPVA